MKEKKRVLRDKTREAYFRLGWGQGVLEDTGRIKWRPHLMGEETLQPR
jgi:hypothetical protein